MRLAWDSYDADPEGFARQYESLPFEVVHSDLLGCIPGSPATVLDVGAGSGRDAEWFAFRGDEVVAAEPSSGMRSIALAAHPSPRIRWTADSMPGLEEVSRSGIAFDFILLSGVWMHVPPADRPRAFRKLAALLAPGGRIAFSLRHGPDPPGRTFHMVSAGEVEALAAKYGLSAVLAARREDSLGRPEVSWTTLVFQLPDDGTGALPLLRSIILRDRKSSTYKLGLLRVLCRIAEDYPGLAREEGEGGMAVPLGLVALNWLRAYLPLYRLGLPQHPQPATGFLGTLARLVDLDPAQLRPGLGFHGASASNLIQSMREACRTIAVMPATYITAPGDGRPVFAVRPGGVFKRVGIGETLVLDEPTLWSFGTFLVPSHLWCSFRRLAPWIEPLLRQEWVGYMASRSQEAHGMDLWDALTWVDPKRDTLEVRALATGMLEAGRSVFCVWTGKSLGDSRLDIDHCFPLAAWPCQDLWNLLPSHPSINRSKSDRLVSAERLDASRERILDWWHRAFLGPESTGPRERFLRESQMTLTIPSGTAIAPESIFQGVAMKRLTLRRIHQLQEW